MFTSSYKVAVIQLNSQENLEKNLDSSYELIHEAVANHAMVVALPENFAFLGGLEMRQRSADEIAERVPQFLSSIAREMNVYILGGSYPVPASEGKVFNRSEMYAPDGSMVCNYDKVHLFDITLNKKELYKESSYVKSGKAEAKTFADKYIGCWGLSVCYDIRFPEYYRKLTEKGAEVLSVPSAFTYTTGKDHWEPLLRTRAIENTCFVIAPAQTGMHGKNRRTWGHSMIVSPWGDIMADAGTEPGIIYGEIDPEKITEVRRKIPSLKHRRF